MCEEIALPGRIHDTCEQEKFMVGIIGRIHNENGCVIVATLPVPNERRRQIVGFTVSPGIYYEFGVRDKVFQCEAVYVLPEHRNKHIGNMLLEKLEEEAICKGGGEVEFHSKFDEKLIRRYSKLGYIPHMVFYRKPI